MVIDTIENLKNYVGMNPLFAEVVKYIAEHDLATMEEGKHYIQDKDLFVNITTAKGKTPDEAVMETHVEMIDIQIPLDEEETYGYLPLEDLPQAEYNAEKDITKYPGVPGSSYVTCRPGMMAIFFPQDGHAPCICAAPQVKKAIFKVKVC